MSARQLQTSETLHNLLKKFPTVNVQNEWRSSSLSMQTTDITDKLHGVWFGLSVLHLDKSGLCVRSEHMPVVTMGTMTNTFVDFL